MTQIAILFAAILATAGWAGNSADRDSGADYRRNYSPAVQHGDDRDHHFDHDAAICGAPDLITLLDQVHSSCCGAPRDPGNEIGVGKFCLTDVQCKHTQATICSAAENATADHTSFYCTRLCDPGAPDPGCGTGAACNCEGEACVCTPTSCIEHPPEGCEGP